MTLAELLEERDMLEWYNNKILHDNHKKTSIRKDELDYEIQKELMR